MIRVEGGKEEFARDGKNCQRCGVQSHDGGKVQDRVRKPNRYSACFIVYYPMGGRAFRLGNSESNILMPSKGTINYLWNAPRLKKGNGGWLVLQ